MLFTPEMEELLPQLGKKVRKPYNQLKKKFEDKDDLEKVDPQTLQWAFEHIEGMKPIFVGVKHLNLYQTMLAFLQITLAQGLPEDFKEKSMRHFVYWTNKLSQFREKKKWWSYANHLIAKIEK